MPGLGAHRVQKKQECVQGVLNAQSHFRSAGATDMAVDGLAALSRCMSAPSKRFARALGVVDGTLALLEYASSSSMNNESDIVIKSQPLCVDLEQVKA